MNNRFLKVSLGEIGFCGGVSRADKIIEEIRNKEEGDIFVLGDIIHNSSYKKMLEKERIFSLYSLEEAKDKIIIIRTHGIPPLEEKKLYSLAKKVYDLTCPLVKTIHQKVEDFYKKGYTIFIIGDPTHAETVGTVGYAENVSVIKKEEDIKKIPLELLQKQKIVLLAQSTFGQDSFLHLSALLKEKMPHILIENTLCYAPTQRQEEISSLVKENDMVLVIGGVHSSNTIKLFERAKNESKNGKVYHIEEPKEIDDINFMGVKSVGVTSGTSTPDFLIQELVKKLEQIPINY